MSPILSILLAFLFSFSVFFLLNGFTPNTTPSINQNLFWNEDFSKNEKTVFLFGSSHVGQLNATYIQEKINHLPNTPKVFNLAYDSDKPSIRIDTIEKTVSLNPTLILYGISYFDLADSAKEITVPGLGEIYNEFVAKNYEFFEIHNPKWTTLNTIKIIAANMGINLPTREVVLIDNTPFYNYQKSQTVIATNSELIRQTKNFPLDFTISIKTDNQEIEDLKKIITTLKENDIEIILFVTPVSSAYFESLNNEPKDNFHQKIEDISNEFGISVIDLSQKYSDYEIWADPTHVALNKKSLIYSKQIVKIINEELE